jgi:argininosuccinate lyase
MSVYRSRLREGLDRHSEDFISSLKSDRELFEYEIESSLAHTLMLREQRVLNHAQAKKLASALTSLRAPRIPSAGFEDIHEYVESAVTKIAGEDAGERLHTGRSRNDQVATITRMFCRENLLKLGESLLGLAKTLSQLAEKHRHDPFLSYTHLQQAQIQSLGHQLQSYLVPSMRDLERISECYARTNISPLGASAGAGSTIKLSRTRTARLLGFEGVMENCQDAVQSRDYAIEAVYIQSLIMIELSRIAEDLILWTTKEFNYYHLPDSLSSPSSVMPQKKNSDVLEMVRANAAKQLANLVQMLTLLKGLPSGYNRDLQNEKEVLIQSFPITIEAIRTIERCLRQGSFNTNEMRKRAAESDAFALPLAEWLVLAKGISFRTAHRIAGRIIISIGPTRIPIGKQTPNRLQELLTKADGPKLSIDEAKELRQRLTPDGTLAATATEGGPFEAQVLRTHSQLKKELNRISQIQSSFWKHLQDAQENLRLETSQLDPR